jgi:hypothetical protein
MNKLEQGAPVAELQRLIMLEMASIVKEGSHALDALAPNQLNLRTKETLRHLRRQRVQLRGLRELGRYIKHTHKSLDNIDWEGYKFIYVVDQLMELAVECLRKTGQTDHVVQSWKMHYHRELGEKLGDICRTADGR